MYCEQVIPINQLHIIGYAARVRPSQTPYYPPLIFSFRTSRPNVIILPPYRTSDHGQSLIGTTPHVREFWALINSGEATSFKQPCPAKPNHALLLVSPNEYRYFPQDQVEEQERHLWQELLRAALKRHVADDRKATIETLVRMCRICRHQAEEVIALSFLDRLNLEPPGDYRWVRERLQRLIDQRSHFREIPDRVRWLLSNLGHLQ